MDKLRECPFCDKDVAEISNCQELEGCRHFEKCPSTEPYVCVVCNMHEGGCGASGGYYDSAEKAIAAWNSRADARQLALKTRVCPMCEDCPDGCPVETPKDSRNIVTNADRIRSMTDEELVEFICGIDGVGDPDYCAIVEVCPDELEFNMYTPAENCMRCCFRWLQQPVEVVNSD